MRFAFLQRDSGGSGRHDNEESANHASTKSTGLKGKCPKARVGPKKQAVDSSASAMANDEEPKEEQDVVICGRCDKRGHLKANCPTSMKSRTGKKQLSAMAAVPDEDLGSEVTATSAVTTCKSSKRDVWIGDSGASQHITFSREGMHDYLPASKRSTVGLAGGFIE